MRRGAARARLRGGAIGLACALALFPAVVSARLIASHAQDSGTPGALAPASLSALSTYLRAHQGAAPNEAAFLPVAEAGGLIARDARPVVLLTALRHPLVDTAHLRRLITTRRACTRWSSGARTRGSPCGCARTAPTSAPPPDRARGTVYGF